MMSIVGSFYSTTTSLTCQLTESRKSCFSIAGKSTQFVEANGSIFVMMFNKEEGCRSYYKCEYSAKCFQILEERREKMKSNYFEI